MVDILISFWAIVAVMGVGYLLAKFKITRDGADAALSRITFYALMPAMLFRTVVHADLSTAFSWGAFVSVSSALILAGIFWLASARMDIRGPERTIGSLCACYTNAGNIGVAYLMATTGDASAVAPIMVFQLCIVTPIVFTILGRQTGRTHTSFLSSVGKSFLNPPVIGVIAGLVVGLTGWDVPRVIAGPVNYLADTAVPLMLLTVGISFAGARLPSLNGPLVTACVLRSIASPALCFGIGYLVGLEGLALQSITIAGSIPVANNVFVYAHRYGTGVKFAREAILITTFASLIVTLLIAWAFHTIG